MHWNRRRRVMQKSDLPLPKRTCSLPGNDASFARLGL